MKFDSLRIPTTVALAQPSVRMCVVSASAWPDAAKGHMTGDHEIVPVLALQSSIVSEFSRPSRPKDMRRPATVQAALASGWAHEGTSVETDALVYCPQREAVVPAAEAFDACNVAYQVVPCPWLPSDDAAKLTGIIQRLRTRAFALAVKAEQRRNGKTPPGPELEKGAKFRAAPVEGPADAHR